MPRFAANISTMFTEWDFLDRLDAAAEAGFRAVECQSPYGVSADALAARLSATGLTLALFNLPAGDWEAGERGLAALSDRFEAFRDGVAQGLDYALATKTTQLHMMAGLAGRGDAAAEAAYRRSLDYAAERLGAAGIEVMIEPINPRSMPGYFLADFDDAVARIEASGRPNVRLQFDVFHRQILHGDVVTGFRRLLPVVGHVQIASVPSRNEPDAEELNYPYLFAQFDRLGYRGFVGCEYSPRGATLDGLDWFKPWAGRQG